MRLIPDSMQHTLDVLGRVSVVKTSTGANTLVLYQRAVVSDDAVVSECWSVTVQSMSSRGQ